MLLSLLLYCVILWRCSRLESSSHQGYAHFALLMSRMRQKILSLLLLILRRQPLDGNRFRLPESAWWKAPVLKSVTFDLFWMEKSKFFVRYRISMNSEQYFSVLILILSWLSSASVAGWRCNSEVSCHIAFLFNESIMTLCGLWHNTHSLNYFFFFFFSASFFTVMVESRTLLRCVTNLLIFMSINNYFWRT